MRWNRACSRSTQADRETINTIFRAAHSIKGGAGTFGFLEISQFTHSVETLLDEMRNGMRAVTPDAVQVLLQSVDVIREMTQSAQAKQPIVTVGADALSGELARILAQKSGAAAAPAAGAAPRLPPAQRPLLRRRNPPPAQTRASAARP
jgi:two-component system, chemotaxis family, sensor kinase CheA